MARARAARGEEWGRGAGQGWTGRTNNKTHARAAKGGSGRIQSRSRPSSKELG